jgi:hypothetical protein
MIYLGPFAGGMGGPAGFRWADAAAETIRGDIHGGPTRAATSRKKIHGAAIILNTPSVKPVTTAARR